MKHTRGPWEVRGQEIYGNEPNGYICKWSGRSANASLIAAAPELLEALKMAVAVMQNNNIDESMAGKFEVFTDAINKAKGESC